MDPIGRQLTEANFFDHGQYFFFIFSLFRIKEIKGYDNQNAIKNQGG